MDLRGSGGSSGEITSIGYHEAKDVEASVRSVTTLLRGDPDQWICVVSAFLARIRA